MREQLRAELVQVAAVAVAIVEDLETGSASMAGLSEVLANVAEERDRQNARWGSQHHTPVVWLAILAEEVGEVAREVESLVGPDRSMGPLTELLVAAEDTARWVLDCPSGPDSRSWPPPWSQSRGRHLAAGAE